MMKRVFSFVISIVMILGCAGAFSAGAESSEKALITAGGTTCEVSAGDEIVYTAKLDYKKGISSMQGYITYDPEILTYIEEEEKTCIPNFYYPSVGAWPKECKIKFNGSKDMDLVKFSQNQVLVTLKFKVKTAAPCELKLFLKELYGANRWVVAQDGVFKDKSAILTETVSTEREPRYLVITHNGDTYKAKVGDVITYTLYLKAPEKIRHLSAGVYFDYNYLWAEETEFKEKHPNLFEGGDEYVGNSQEFYGTVTGKGFATSEYEVLAQYSLEVLKEGKENLKVYYELFTEDGTRYSSLTDTKVKLKSKITVKSDDTAEGDELLGDVDGNGEVNIKDATTVQKAAAKVVALDKPAQLCSDVNADGKVNIKDATAIQKYLAKINTGYDIGKPLKNK